MTPSRKQVIHAYRALYRAGLVAVQYSTPARYAIRDKLRTAFRQRSPERFDQERIKNTLHFLKAAGERVGIEHRIVRNLCMVHHWQYHTKHRRQGDATRRVQYSKSYDQYDETLRLLNESAELDLV